jgi:RimJ/RimL family protein N-acetyltransferase
MHLTLLPATEVDSEFVYQANRDAMREYVEDVWGPWDEDQQRQLHGAGFVAGGGWFVVESDGDRVGVVQYQCGDEHVWLGRITLLRAHQGRGIGTAVIERLRADHPDKCVRLRVLEVNRRARSLYERLGFRILRVDPPHVYMEAPAQLG